MVPIIIITRHRVFPHLVCSLFLSIYGRYRNVIPITSYKRYDGPVYGFPKLPVSETIPEGGFSALKPAQNNHLTYRDVSHPGIFIDQDGVIALLVHALAGNQ